MAGFSLPFPCKVLSKVLASSGLFLYLVPNKNGERSPTKTTETMKTTTITKETLNEQIQALANDEGLTFPKACQAVQATAATMGREDLIEIIHDLKMESVAKMQESTELTSHLLSLDGYAMEDSLIAQFPHGITTKNEAQIQTQIIYGSKFESRIFEKAWGSYVARF